MVTTTQNSSNGKLPELLVEIELDGSVVQRTGRVKQQRMVSWNEELRIVGRTSSILCLLIKRSTSSPIADDLCIGRTSMIVDALLTRCANNSFTALDIQSRVDGPNNGIITVKLIDLADLENHTTSLQEKVDSTDDGHPNKALYLSDLGLSQTARFERLDQSDDINDSILNLQKAVNLTDREHPSMAARLANLGFSQGLRFDRIGNTTDLKDSISNLHEAINISTDEHPDRPKFYANLGMSLMSHFQRFGDPSDIDDSILNLSMAIGRIDDEHPDKSWYHSVLGASQALRFEHFEEADDIDDSIANLQEAVNLLGDSNVGKPGRLSNLGLSQSARFTRFAKLPDLDNSLSNMRAAVELVDDSHPERAMYLSNLGSGEQIRYEHLGEPADLQMSISHLQEAVDLTEDGNPDRPRCLSGLGISQCYSYERYGKLIDIENSIRNTRTAIQLTDDDDPEMATYISNLANSQQSRFERLGKIADLDDSIFNLQEVVKRADYGQPDKAMYLSNLGHGQRLRFERLGDMSDLDNSITNLEQAVELVDDDNPKIALYMANLASSLQCRAERYNTISDIDTSIMVARKAVEVGTSDQARYHIILGNSLGLRFGQLRELGDLDNAILNKQMAVDITDDEHYDKPDLEKSIYNAGRAAQLIDGDHPHKSMYLCGLGDALNLRFKRSSDQDDMNASVTTYKEAAKLKTAYPRHALLAARKWAELSYQCNDVSSALDGYRIALEILPKVAWLGLDTTSVQDTLYFERSESLGCNSAACAIRLGRLAEAVELLDMSRSFFWQQASSLRSDFEKLKDRKPQLAEELEDVGRQLDKECFIASINDGTAKDTRADPHTTKDIARERHVLGGVWDRLLGEVRGLPEFENFLRPVPFDQLRQAANGGRIVIIINASEYGVDALIFDDVKPIHHIPLPDADYDILVKFANKIVLERPINGTADQQHRYLKAHLKPALRRVWDDIVDPIFNEIKIPLEVDAAGPQQCIWWYLTGPLTFIPIHAAGPGRVVDVSRLVISSYLTTLDTLFRTQNKKMQGVMAPPKLLAVSQPQTPGQPPLPLSTEEAKKVTQMFRSAGMPDEDIVHLDGSEATIGCVSATLETSSWVHFACHGLQHQYHAFAMKSGFALNDGNLELSQIASKRLHTARFAFLSVCDAAAGIQGLPGEAMHLAGGLQFAGFQSVIATMWSICDEDAPKVADLTYQYLFRNGLEGLDHSEASTALNRAVASLRENVGMTLDRWAPFIHFGL